MTEEDVFVAIFNLVSTATGFVTRQRRLQLWTDIKASAKPALILYQKEADYVRDGEWVPEKITLNADIFIYTRVSSNPDTVPATPLNTLVAAVRNTLAPDPLTRRQTLGGIVSHCWIEGKTMFTPGDLDNDGLAVLPIKILIPTFN